MQATALPCSSSVKSKTLARMPMHLPNFNKPSLGLADAPLYNNMLAAAIGAQRQAKTSVERATFIAAAETIIQGPGGQYVSTVNMGINYFYAAQDQVEQQP